MTTNTNKQISKAPEEYTQQDTSKPLISKDGRISIVYGITAIPFFIIGIIICLLSPIGLIFGIIPGIIMFIGGAGLIAGGILIIAQSPNAKKNVIKVEAKKRLMEQEKEDKIEAEIQKLQTV